MLLLYPRRVVLLKDQASCHWIRARRPARPTGTSGSRPSPRQYLLTGPRGAGSGGEEGGWRWRRWSVLFAPSLPRARACGEREGMRDEESRGFGVLRVCSHKVANWGLRRCPRGAKQ